MTEALTKLPFGNTFNGKHCQTACLSSPMGRGLLLLDQYRTMPVTYMLELVSISTTKIGTTQVKPTGDDLEKIREFWRGCTLDDLQVASKSCATSVWSDDEVSDTIMQMAICTSCKKVNEYPIPLSEIEVKSGEFPKEIRHELKKPWKVLNEEVKFVLIHPFTVKNAILLESYLESPVEYSYRRLARMIVTGNGNKPELDDIANMHTMDRKDVEKKTAQFDAIDTFFERTCKKCGAPVRGTVDLTSFF